MSLRNDVLITDCVEISKIWGQSKIPVIKRLTKGKIKIHTPYAPDNRKLLTVDAQNEPHWNTQLKQWELPLKHLTHTVESLLRKYKSLYIIQPYNEKQVCTASCKDAIGYICECSCNGANHGNGVMGKDWFVVSDHFAIKYKRMACILLKVKD